MRAFAWSILIDILRLGTFGWELSFWDLRQEVSLTWPTLNTKEIGLRGDYPPVGVGWSGMGWFGVGFMLGLDRDEFHKTSYIYSDPTFVCLAAWWGGG